MSEHQFNSSQKQGFLEPCEYSHNSAEKKSSQFAFNSISQINHSSGKSSLNNKRQQFRLQIRKQKIEQIFRCKRTILIQENKQQMEREIKAHSLIKQNPGSNQMIEKQGQDYFKQPLEYYLQEIIKENQVLLNMNHIAQILNDQNCLQKNYKTLKAQGIVIDDSYQQYCSEICLKTIDIIVKRIFPLFRAHSSTNQYSRMVLLQAITNILYHKQCQSQLVQLTISQFLKKQYGSPEKWRETTQIIEIGYLLGNLFKGGLLSLHSLTGSQSQSIIVLLSWVQQVITIREKQMLKILYEQMNYFFKQVDAKYSGNREYSCYQCLVEHFKTQRLMIIQKTIDSNISAHNADLFKGVSAFLFQNQAYLICLDDKKIDELIRKVFNCIKSSLHYTPIAVSGLKLLNILAVHTKFGYRVAEIGLMDEYYISLIQKLGIVQVNVKIMVVQLLNKMMVSEGFVEHFVNEGLQHFMESSMRNQIIKDNELLKQIMLLTQKMYCVSEGKHGITCLQIIKSKQDLQGTVLETALHVTQVCQSQCFEQRDMK